MKTFTKQVIAVIALVAVIAASLPIAAFGMAEMNANVQPDEIWDGSIADGFAGGSGTENNPYLISNGSELAYLAQQTNSGVSYAGLYFKLTNDICLNDTTDWESWGHYCAPANEWVPIGAVIWTPDEEWLNYIFAGCLDGNGHVIRGVYIDSNDGHQGLFGHIDESSVISNLGVAESYISGAYSVGGIVAVVEGGTVTNCYNAGNVSGGNYIGGVVGFNDPGLVSNCYNTGSVNGVNAVGGVVGWNWGGVINCYNIGSVSGNEYVGGAVGANNYCVVHNCYYLDTSCESGDEYAVALTDEQMREADSFVGFDFNEVWTMEGSAEYPYPELISNPHMGSAMLGDLDGDGVITVVDANAALRIALDLEDFNPIGDLDSDGAVTLADVNAILRLALGL